MVIAYNPSDDDRPAGGSGGNDKSNDTPAENQGTLILDATCAPQQISFSQDINLLNEARENLESLIDDICFRFNYYEPRMYRRNARKDYLEPAKCKKRTAKRSRKAIRKQLQYVNRDPGYVDILLAQDDVFLKPKQAECFAVIRGKAKAPVEFGAKLDMGIDERGMARLEKYLLMHITNVMCS